MRSGAQAPDDDSTRQFKAQSQRLMGDMNDAGDAPFGGEMQVDSQVPGRACSVMLAAVCMSWLNEVTGGDAHHDACIAKVMIQQRYFLGETGQASVVSVC